MVGTVGAARRLGGRTALVVSTVAYSGGLLLGSALVFGALGLAGALLGPGAGIAGAAAVLAAGAALADAAGLRVRPQIHTQVPERWRRTMPLRRAVFLYGVLLGTGLATFVPAAAAWGLLVLALAIGNVPLALGVGLCLAVGRALPVLLFARRGREITFVTERPGALRLVRGLAALSLAIAVAALVGGEVQAATTVSRPAGDPSAVGTDLVWQTPGVGGFLRRGGVTTKLPGSDPALGDTLVAWHDGDAVTIASRATLTPVLQETIRGVQKLALSQHWLAFRARRSDGSLEIAIQAITTTPGIPTVIAARRPGELGRPFVVGGLTLFHVSSRTGSWITAFDMTTGKRRTVRRSTSAEVLNPSVLNGELVYVRVSRCSQELRAGGIAGGAERVLYRLPPLAGWDLGHDRDRTGQGSRRPCAGPPRPTARMLWTTAVAPGAAYVTTLRPAPGGRATPTLLRISR
jgi:hypothetical protein